MGAVDVKEFQREAPPEQVLTFILAGDPFGVDIRRVREIRSWQAIRSVPESSPDVLGVLDLRGGMVPVFDLRARLSLPQGDPSSGVIIIVSVGDGAGRRDVGLVVDGVSDVASVPAEGIREMPDFSGRVRTDFVNCILTLASATVLVIDVDSVLGAQA